MSEKKIVRIGNTTFDVDSVKKMGFEKFKTHFHESLYEQVTGEKPKAKKPKKSTKKDD